MSIICKTAQRGQTGHAARLEMEGDDGVSVRSPCGIFRQQQQKLAWHNAYTVQRKSGCLQVSVQHLHIAPLNFLVFKTLCFTKIKTDYWTNYLLKGELKKYLNLATGKCKYKVKSKR